MNLSRSTVVPFVTDSDQWLYNSKHCLSDNRQTPVVSFPGQPG